jgi:cytochrome c553
VKALGVWLLSCAAVVPAAAQTHTERYAQQCAACHGAAGKSEIALTPSLGGQPSFYAITQLFLFRQGRRDNEAMVAVAKGMSDDDLRGYADAIAKLPPPAPPTSAPDMQRIERGRATAQRHQCGACHGGDFAGGQQVARLAHQREDYLVHTLRGFKSGQRIGYTTAMNEAIAGVSAGEIEDLAHYLAHLPAR